MSILADQWGIHPQHVWLRGHRPEQPVHYDERLGTWQVYGYPEALEVLSDPKTFSSDTARLFPVEIDESVIEGNMVQTDPPLHGKLRKIVSHAFTPKSVADLAPRIDRLTHELLDAVAGQDRIELIADLAYPLPVTVIAELLGVPSSDRAMFKEWVDKLFETMHQFSLISRREEQERNLQAQMEQNRVLNDYIHEHAAERRRKPRQDLLTKIVEAKVDGERLTDIQVMNFASILLIAGYHTITMMLGNTMLCLDRYPDQAARVRADRSMVPTAIEESLRFLTPTALIYRVTTTEVEIAGQRIPANRMLAVWAAAANRDQRQFADPEVFDPARHPNPHLALGRGIHFCLGATLARLEGRIALNILLDRFPELRTLPDDPPVFLPSPDMTGLRALPLRAGRP
ncbi:cytochrome P450 [Streptomyces sp. CB02923]|uniref:cytochrome P450 n=1 Tax=Streptomyces sp. CB02923 TaxID=1718985 RepID=UPI00093AF0F0|nr:cytochrome P450 [Streptomyces sp. CB02923]OKH99039.1 cytochrome P450 [Streptomyces sp. CB02923]